MPLPKCLNCFRGQIDLSSNHGSRDKSQLKQDPNNSEEKNGITESPTSIEGKTVYVTRLKAPLPKSGTNEDFSSLQALPPTAAAQGSETQTPQLVKQREVLEEILNSERTGNKSKPEEYEAFHLIQLLDVVISGTFNDTPDIAPQITYFGCKSLKEYLAYCKLLKEPSYFDMFSSLLGRNDKMRDVWDTLEKSIEGYVTKDNFESPIYFSKMIMKLNLAIAEKSQKNEPLLDFKSDNDAKFDMRRIISDTESDHLEEQDTGFNDPEEKMIGNVSVSICEVQGWRSHQEDQYYVETSEIDESAVPSKLKSILEECESCCQRNQRNPNVGSTATLTYISKKGMITVASLGDSPALFLAKHKKTNEVTMVPLTRDHEPTHFFEKSRIQKNGDTRNFAQRCVSYALNCGSEDNITAIAAALSEYPEQGVVLGVFDGHNGNEASTLCKTKVQEELSQDFVRLKCKKSC